MRIILSLIVVTAAGIFLIAINWDKMTNKVWTRQTLAGLVLASASTGASLAMMTMHGLGKL